MTKKRYIESVLFGSAMFLACNIALCNGSTTVTFGGEDIGTLASDIDAWTDSTDESVIVADAATFTSSQKAMQMNSGSAGTTWTPEPIDGFNRVVSLECIFKFSETDSLPGAEEIPSDVQVAMVLMNGQLHAYVSVPMGTPIVMTPQWVELTVENLEIDTEHYYRVRTVINYSTGAVNFYVNDLPAYRVDGDVVWALYVADNTSGKFSSITFQGSGSLDAVTLADYSSKGSAMEDNWLNAICGKLGESVTPSDEYGDTGMTYRQLFDYGYTPEELTSGTDTITPLRATISITGNGMTEDYLDFVPNHSSRDRAYTFYGKANKADTWHKIDEWDDITSNDTANFHYFYVRSAVTEFED